MNKLFSLNQDLIQKTNSYLKFHKDLINDIETFKRYAYIFRLSNLELSRIIDEELHINSQRSILIGGERGTGKSISFLQAVSQLLHKPERPIVFAVPYLRNLISGEYAFSIANNIDDMISTGLVSDDLLKKPQIVLHDKSMSSTKNLYNIPEVTNKLMKLFIEINESNPKLDCLVINQKFSLGNQAAGSGKTHLFEAGTSVKEIIQKLGKDCYKFYPLFLSTLISPVEKYPDIKVVIATDMLNGLYGRTNYRDSDGEYIPASQFLPTRLLGDVFEQKKKDKESSSAILLGSLSGWTLGPSNVQHCFETLKSRFDRHLCTKNYDLKELDSVFSYYSRAGFLPRDQLSEETIKKAHFITCGNPREAFDFCLKLPLLQD